MAAISQTGYYLHRNMIGRTLAHYKIQEKIGSGGMGDVYLAEDTKLDRKVALKVLPPELADDEERRARFQREAKAIAALDHPNIVQVFSVEDAEGTHFITMQLVHGKTLTELLPKNGFTLSKFFEIAIPLADGVAAAHREGIAHRDLKPDNIMLSDDGRVKVLDFGLAKSATGLVASDAESAAPTEAKTAEGVIVGTLQYMSPEQAQGKAVDERSDIFSLGVVLYEMLTGRRPFRGENPTEILSSIIKDSPKSTSELEPSIPRDLSKLVRRCLAKHPDRRLQSALDLRNELEETKQDVDSGVAFADVQPRRLRTSRRMLLLAGALIAIAAVASFIWFAKSREPSGPRLSNAVLVTSGGGVEDWPTWSPDGGRIAYHSDQDGNPDIWVTQVSGGPPVNLTSDNELWDLRPAWSPDGSLIAFASLARDGAGCYVQSALGGDTPRLVVPGGNVPVWSPDGKELACVAYDETRRRVLRIVDIDLSEARDVELPGRSSNRPEASWSPGGRYVAYVDSASARAEVTRLHVVRLADGAVSSLTDGLANDRHPQWSEDGRTLFFVSNRGGAMDLWRQPLTDGWKPSGAPSAMTSGVGMRSARFSPDGSKLAYSRGAQVANIWRVPILEDDLATWGEAEQLTFDAAFIEFIDVSADGRRLVFSSDRAGNQDLWLMSLDGRETRQLTTDPTPDWAPLFSPDEQSIAYYAYRSGNRDVWVKPVAGGPARQVTVHESSDMRPTWSPDGTQLAFYSSRSGTNTAWVIPAEGGAARQLMERSSNFPLWSADGSSTFVSVVVDGRRDIWRVPAQGGESEGVIENTRELTIRSRDGRGLYFSRRDEDGFHVWHLSLPDRSEQRMTALIGKRGRIGPYGLASDDEYLYFTWEEDVGDIWVMDVAQ